jgi:hypothetical protein
MLKESPARSYLASLKEISGLDPDHEFAASVHLMLPQFPCSLQYSKNRGWQLFHFSKIIVNFCWCQDSAADISHNSHEQVSKLLVFGLNHAGQTSKDWMFSTS